MWLYNSAQLALLSCNTVLMRASVLSFPHVGQVWTLQYGVCTWHHLDWVGYLSKNALGLFWHFIALFMSQHFWKNVFNKKASCTFQIVWSSDKFWESTLTSQRHCHHQEYIRVLSYFIPTHIQLPECVNCANFSVSWTRWILMGTMPSWG